MTRDQYHQLTRAGAQIRRQELLAELQQLDQLLKRPGHHHQGSQLPARKRRRNGSRGTWSAARRKAFSRTLKHRGWTAARRAKFKATMAAKKAARQISNTGGVTK